MNINLTGYHLAFADASVLLHNPSWTIILLTLPTTMFLGAIFRHITGHDNNDLGIFGKLVRAFGKLVCAIEYVWLGCCVFVKKVHEGTIEGLLQCSCSDARDGDEVSTVSSPPCYTVSPHYISKRLLLISHFTRLLALTKHLRATTENLTLWLDLLLYNDFEVVILRNDLLLHVRCELPPVLESVTLFNFITTHQFIALCNKRQAWMGDIHM